MKILMKVFVAFALAALITPIYAQVVTIKGGLNLSNVLAKDDEDTYSDDFKMKPGFHFGLAAEFPINEMASFETGLLLSTKGYKADESETYSGQTVSYEEKVSLLYLDIPLLAKAKFNVEGAKIYGALGPYIGIGLSGKSKYEMSGMGESESEEEDIKWGSGDEDHLKRLDFGLSLGAGVEVKSLQIGLFYNLGLANISANTDDGAKINNRVLGISVGYILNSSK